MVTVTLELFADRLVSAGLFSKEELTAFSAGLPPEKTPRDAQGLARELIHAGKLTKHQAAAVYLGETNGLVLGNYVVLDKLGAGGMGEVYRARHRVMEREVALKVLPESMVDSPEAVKRFHREVKAAARLDHPNIVAAYDADKAGGRHFLVMQYVDGCDLSSIIRENGPTTIDQAIDCCIQAARGLAYAHQQGVIHRDIKPSNLLLDKSGQIKVLDMGLARLEGQIDDDSALGALTQAGQIMGTTDYMAPEQAEDTHLADHRSDIYSLGCTLYVLLTAKAPFGGTTIMQKLMAHLQQPVPKLSDARGDASSQLDAVLVRMMAKKPENRYQSMNEVIDALQQCLAPQQQHAAGALAGQSSDSNLSAFFDLLASEGKRAVAVKGSTGAAVHEETFNRQPALENTGTGISRPPRVVPPAPEPSVPAGQQRSRPPLALLAIGGGLLSFCILIGVLALLVMQPWKPGKAGNNVVETENGNDDSGLAGGENVPPPPQPPGVDVDRQAAEWAISRGGGSVSLLEGERLITARQLKELPSQPFSVTKIEIKQGPPLTAADSRLLARLARLEHLVLYSVEVSPDFLRPLVRLRNMHLSSVKPQAPLFEAVVGLKELRRLTYNFSPPNEDLSRLGELPLLQEANFWDCSSVTDNTLAAWAKCPPPKLRELTLNGAAITDAGLPHLAAIEHLDSLGLGDCRRLTGGGLLALANCSALSRLDAGGIQFTKEEATRLQEALGWCRLDGSTADSLPALYEDPEYRRTLFDLAERNYQVRSCCPVATLIPGKPWPAGTYRCYDIVPAKDHTAAELKQLADTVKDVSSLRLYSPFSAGGFEQVLRMRNLNHLGGALADEEAARLFMLPKLQSIGLDTASDAQVAQAAKLPHLSRLTIRGSQVTDASLPLLEQVKQLTYATFNSTNLEGWEFDPGVWRVENGEIVGANFPKSLNSRLRLMQPLSDFTLSFDVQVKLKDPKNTGQGGELRFLSDGKAGAQLRLNDSKDMLAQAEGAVWTPLADRPAGIREKTRMLADAYIHYEVTVIDRQIAIRIQGLPAFNGECPTVPRGHELFWYGQTNCDEIRIRNMRFIDLSKSENN